MVLFCLMCAMLPLHVFAQEVEVRRLSVTEYRDKMKGGWIGQICGVSWGAPTEFRWRDKIVPMEQMPKWSPEMINHAFNQDDLYIVYVEMTFLRTMKQYGLDFRFLISLPPLEFLLKTVIIPVFIGISNGIIYCQPFHRRERVHVLHVKGPAPSRRLSESFFELLRQRDSR